MYVWQARKKRVEIEGDIAGKEDDCDTESNTETREKQTHLFPTAEERKQYYREAHEVTRQLSHRYHREIYGIR